jgi:hypothetical protein
MSVYKRNGRWQVKYRIGDRQRSCTFDRKGDAETFDAEIRRRKQLGRPSPPSSTAPRSPSTATCGAPWRAHSTTLAAPSRAKYAWALEKHLSELLNEPLVAIDVARLAEHQRLLLDRGATPTTVREVFVSLSGILQTAVEQGQLPANAARCARSRPTPARRCVPSRPSSSSG